MFKIIRICAVVGTIAVLSPVHNSPGELPLAVSTDAATALGGALGSLSGDLQGTLREVAIAEARRRVAALEEAPSRDTLTAGDRRIPWRGPSEQALR